MDKDKNKKEVFKKSGTKTLEEIHKIVDQIREEVEKQETTSYTSHVSSFKLF